VYSAHSFIVTRNSIERFFNKLYLMAELIERHDRARFESSALSCGPMASATACGQAPHEDDRSC